MNQSRPLVEEREKTYRADAERPKILIQCEPRRRHSSQGLAHWLDRSVCGAALPRLERRSTNDAYVLSGATAP